MCHLVSTDARNLDDEIKLKKQLDALIYENKQKQKKIDYFQNQGVVI